MSLLMLMHMLNAYGDADVACSDADALPNALDAAAYAAADSANADAKMPNAACHLARTYVMVQLLALLPLLLLPLLFLLLLSPLLQIVFVFMLPHQVSLFNLLTC